MYQGIQGLLSKLGYLCLILGIVSYLLKNKLPDYKDINKRLIAEPIQRNGIQPHFKIDYRKRSYEVRPRAYYEINALIVSQNNPTGFSDIYHDSSSIDTKDFCVIWGQNLRSNEFRQVNYWSGPWMCYCQWDHGTRFWFNQLSNNHLITNDQEIRDKIAQTGIGDQIHIKGLLVDYRELGVENSGWRNTSLIRTDDGNGACEVVFVKELTILKSSNRIWRQGFSFAIKGLIVILLCKGLLFFVFATKQ